MTEHAMDFANAFVNMAMATKRVPELEAQVSELTKAHEIDADTIQRLELKAIERKNEINTLHYRIRELEVERDNAELRFLECDDAKSTLQRTLQTIIGEARGAIVAVTPEPEPVKVLEATSMGESSPSLIGQEERLSESPESQGSSSVGESAADLTGGETHSGLQNISPEVDSVSSHPTAETPMVDSAHPSNVQTIGVESTGGQSEAPLPTADGTAISSAATVPSEHVESVDSVASTEEVVPTPPFVALSSGEGSQTAGEDAREPASSSPKTTPRPTEDSEVDWFASFSRASHAS
jgi:hypothetical protein